MTVRSPSLERTVARGGHPRRQISIGPPPSLDNVDTLDVAATTQAVADLVGDQSRRLRLQEAAAVTGAAYPPERAALSEYVLFAAEWLERAATRACAAPAP